ncbi:PilW family protein [Luteibacter anthropi]|uniref:PilW family protein n=1 Tax=Luteibacter anthropi TaxID=564369 RepID=UPI002032D247|nr:PilW family protein [Luteibacter anthropi]URX61069.1 PilW family protein [Luteibacter anthropi]
MRHVALSCRTAGLSLIELLVALALGLLVSAGIITIFLSTSASNRVQTQMARMQEDGRFAIGQLMDDLSSANGFYCNNTGGVATPTSSGVFLDGLRSPTIYAKSFLASLSDNTASWGATSGTITYPKAPTAKYDMPSFLYMRGYNCTGSADCAPVAPSFLGGTAATAGTALGNRVIGTDVLTVRFLDGSRGWRLGGTSTIVPNTADGSIASIKLVPATGEPAVTAFGSNMALLADCSTAQVFAVTGKGTSALVPDDANNFGKPIALQPQSAPRLFDFVNDMRNVTYYVQVVSDDGTETGQKTGALMRRVNGTTVPVPDQELIRGVERLTFRYGIEDSSGGVRYLTADQVDSRISNAIACPPTTKGQTVTDPGCLWRAVKSIEVSLLMAGTNTLPMLSSPELSFVYTPDSSDGTNAPVTPSVTDTGKLAIQPSAQGFSDQRLRRQFSALVMLRNYNP